MPSQDFKRSDRIADLIKVEISQVLSLEVRDPRVQGITVLNVLLTSSPSIKKLFFIFFFRYFEANVLPEPESP